MILLYANEHEVRHVDYEPSYNIGLKCRHLWFFESVIKDSDGVILFGCSGWRGEKSAAKLNQLYQWAWGGCDVVDMESDLVYDKQII